MSISFIPCGSTQRLTPPQVRQATASNPAPSLRNDRKPSLGTNEAREMFPEIILSLLHRSHISEVFMPRILTAAEAGGEQLMERLAIRMAREECGA